MSKSNNKTVATKASVKEYLSSIEDKGRRDDCVEIKNLMQKISGSKPVMWGDSLVGFGEIKQVSPSGREVEWIQMGFASRKQAISIYITCNLDLFTKELKKLGTYKRGVGCLYVKKLKDINMKVFEEILTASLKMQKATS